MTTYSGVEIAIIGMAGRFPGAKDIKTFWDNLANAVDSISELSDEEILEEGEEPSILKDPSYVRANAFVADKEYFDSGFFGYRPEEAALMNPQIRLFHEICWHAMEDAGYDIRNNTEKTGLFAGGSTDTNWSNYTGLANEEGQVDDFTASQLREITYLCTRISYLFNLQGPAIFENTACSTSLVAIQRACMSLLLRECTMALAGGICINNYSKKGYLFQEGMINSPDGKCRTFDAAAKGTVGGEGAGVVVLKRLADATRDGDNIYAVIRGSAINNDGNQKISFSAPSVDGQYKVIVKALSMAQAAPESIGYVEAHGTATELGDPVEVEALNNAFGRSSTKYCALGSVKSNIGHLDTAAGVAGLIKAALAIAHRQLPPSLHFKTPNPRINFRDSPFFVNTELKKWHNDTYPLRAGVSSFGIGGTNAHIILEEAPEQPPVPLSRPWQLILLSGRTDAALEKNIRSLADYLLDNKGAAIPDIAYTLQTGRTPFEYRRAIVCRDRAEALAQLQEKKPPELVPASGKNKQTIVFMFPGQGSQYAGMCRELYIEEETFRNNVDKCLAIVKARFDKDLITVLFPDEQLLLNSAIDHTEFAQPALFIIEYALAQMLIGWGIHPDAMIGHSIGEYTAACVSGTFSLEDALALVVKRGEFMQKADKGTMLSVSISENDLRPILAQHEMISLAAVNSTGLCVVSGKTIDIAVFKKVLDDLGYNNRMIRTSHAFHSYMMDGILDEFSVEARNVSIRAGKIPFISNLTGDFATITQADYWVSHLRQPVLFAHGIEKLMLRDHCTFIEVGPGNALCTFARSNRARTKEHTVIQLVRHAQDSESDMRFLVQATGQLWMKGTVPDWQSFYKYEKRKKVSLPGYPFEKIKYPVNVNAYKMITEKIGRLPEGKEPDIRSWAYVPTWKIGIIEQPPAEQQGATLFFTDERGVCDRLIEKMQTNGEICIAIRTGARFREVSRLRYELDPFRSDDYGHLLSDLSRQGITPARIVHAWGITNTTGEGQDPLSAFSYQRSFYSLLDIIEACRHIGGLFGRQLILLTNDRSDVPDSTAAASPGAMAATLLKVAAQECPGLNTADIDIVMKGETGEVLFNNLFSELYNKETGRSVCLGHGRKWVQIYDKVHLRQEIPRPAFRNDGVYLITGGLGAFGYNIAQHLLKRHNAKVILLGRTSYPFAIDSEKSKRYDMLRMASEKVYYIECDIADEPALSRAVKMGEEHFGTINGVLHAAGIVRGQSVNPLSELNRQAFDDQFRSKIAGTIALRNVLVSKDIDWCILAASISTVLGGIGLAAYAAANTFMDQYVLALREKGEVTNWISLDLDALTFGQGSDNAITAEEQIAVMELIPAYIHLPRMIISVSDLHKRLSRWVTKSAPPAAGLPDVADGKAAVGNIINGFNDEQASAANITRRLVLLWKIFFGKTEIDLDEDFFDMGGDSLKALTMIIRIKKEFDIELSIVDFFRFSTPEKLAAHITSLKAEADEAEKNDQQVETQGHYIF